MRRSRKVKTTEPIVVKLLQGQPPVSYPPYTAEIKAYDKKLAEIFGGTGAVAKGNNYDIDGKYRGSMGEGDKDSLTCISECTYTEVMTD